MGRFLFGPVNSRRLGRSLGIDLLPFKTCSLDCIYCECGWTTDLTARGGELVPTSEVLSEIDAALSVDPQVDYVTFSGSGEPTLHTGIGTVITHLKRHHPRYKVAVLTNGTLLGEPAVQQRLALADLVVPSLDGATDRAFRTICRPVPGLTVRAVIEGLVAFRTVFTNRMVLEIFIVPGVNDTPEELAALKRAATDIAPDAIQINGLDRPAPHASVTAPGAERLHFIRDYFLPLPVQAFHWRRPGDPAPWSDPRVFRQVLAVLATSSSRLSRLSAATGIREGDLAKVVAQMSHQSLVTISEDGTIERRIR